MAVLKEAKNVKYGNFVAPGNFLRVDVGFLKTNGTGATFKASGTVGDAQAVSARLEIAYFDLAEKQPNLAEIDARLRAHNQARWALIAPSATTVTL